MLIKYPIILSKYNKYMNCVDTFKKTKIFVKLTEKSRNGGTNFFNYTNATIVNFHILYKIKSGHNIIFIYL